jgi:hypothetical protein
MIMEQWSDIEVLAACKWHSEYRSSHSLVAISKYMVDLGLCWRMCPARPGVAVPIQVKFFHL